MAAIHKALGECSAEHPVFYEDEVDIHLNPKIGADWQLCGQQKRVVTSGQNEKYYLAGALHSGTGKVRLNNLVFELSCHQVLYLCRMLEWRFFELRMGSIFLTLINKWQSMLSPS